MRRFSVWAPRANSVVVSVDGASHPMRLAADAKASESGWWFADVPLASDGSRYAFLLDDDPTPLPDPRSPSQPDGVHAASQLYDQSLFSWTDQGWQAPPLPSAIVYELHIGTFTPEGTFDAAIQRIDHLCSLGVTHVELMPVAAFPGQAGWGYDGVALFAPQVAYGGPDALKRLVDAFHARGLAVLLDVVYNHFGPSGNYTGRFGPYLTDSHSTPWGGAVNFEEAGSHQVRRFFCDNAIMWMRDYHFDGLRLDAVHALVDRSALHFLEQLAAEKDALQQELGRPLVLIAESDLNDPRIVAPRVVAASGTGGCGSGTGGCGMDAQWSDDFHHALFSLLTGEQQGYYGDFGELRQLARSLASAFVYDGAYSVFRGRSHGRPIGGLELTRFLGYIQNHDQVGNRALGDRLHHIVGLDLAKLAAAIVLLSPFVPMIFQGEEFAASTPFQYFADHDDPALARGVSEGRRKEFAAFGWRPQDVPDPEDPATFARSRLQWNDLSQPEHRDMLRWYQRLIALRKLAASADGPHPAMHVSFDERKKWLRMEKGAMTLICNFGDQPLAFEPPADRDMFLSNRAKLSGAHWLVDSGGVAIYLQPTPQDEPAS